MLFISLGGSAARQHQAPGGRCARSPALPSSPCAAAAVAPGLWLAAATAPAQVSPGRAPRSEAGGCGCWCTRLGRAARAQRRRWAQGTGWGPNPGCREWGRCGAREALVAAAVNAPGRGNPRGLPRRLASWALALENQILERRPGTLGGRWGVACSGAGPPLPVPRHEGEGSSVFRLLVFRAALSAYRCRASQSWGRSDSLLGNLAVRSPGSPAPWQRGQGRTAEEAAPAPWALGTTRRERPGAHPERKGQSSRSHTVRTPALPLSKSSAPPSCCGPLFSHRLTSPSFSNNLALRNSRKWEKSPELWNNPQLPPTHPDFRGWGSSCRLEYCFRDNEPQVGPWFIDY